jgi:hypothetical protein
MAALFWDRKALDNYKTLMDPEKGLAPLQREQLAGRVDALRDWPPARWFDLRDRSDGTITFQIENDQFLGILGLYENGVVKITHLELKPKRRG